MRFSLRVSALIAPLVLLFAAAPVALAAGPSISTVSSSGMVTANVATTLSVSVSIGAGIKSCNLYVDSEDIGAMDISGSIASISYTFPRGGVFTVFVFCRDNAGGLASGPNTSIFAQGQIVQTPVFGGGQSSPAAPVDTTPGAPDTTAPTSSIIGGIAVGSLIKLECPEEAAVDHPCHAVYFFGRDGKRHAFPNARVYFTWYGDFDSVMTVSLETLGSMPLGKNVTYRPGVRMVKFATVNRVYAVGKGGVLRWVTTEGVARTLYGDDWNTKIDDIADAFYTNYTFGSDIADAASYNSSAESASTLTIDDGA